MISLGLLSIGALISSGLIHSGAIAIRTVTVLSVVGIFFLSLLQPAWLPFAIPPIPLMLRVIAATSIDVAFAALAFWVLLPGDVGTSFPFILSVFLVGLGAGLISGTPFGLGPFEMCILTLLPQVPTAELLAAILGFRLVYFAIPACLATVVLAWPPAPPQETGVGRLRQSAPSLSAEAGFAAISDAHSITRLAQSTCVTANSSQGLVVIGDPVCGRTIGTSDLNKLSQIANDCRSLPMIYKCTKRAAAAARRAGWTAVAISEDAWIEPQKFDLDTPPRRQLRRKLRQADRAEIVVELANELPFEAMANVANSWSRRNGGERGFSMGRFSRQYVSRQSVLLAYHKENLIAFATFHAGPNNWALDLLRSQGGAPDGTMHALIVSAIQRAKLAGIARLSLSAMPLKNSRQSNWFLANRSCGAGLRQFKLSFAPLTDTLYAAAPTRPVLILCGLDILLRILRPALPADELSGDAGSSAMKPNIAPDIRPPFARSARPA